MIDLVDSTGRANGITLTLHVNKIIVIIVKYFISHRHEAERLEQEAKGRLERQKISDEAEAEKARKELLELQANSAAVESTGQAKAEAQSRAEASRIEGEAAVEQAKLKVSHLNRRFKSRRTDKVHI